MYSSRPLAALRLNAVKQRMAVTKLESKNFPIYFYGRALQTICFLKLCQRAISEQLAVQSMER